MLGPTNARAHVCKHVGRKGLVVNRPLQSAGVTREVNLRNPLYAGEKAHRGGIHPGFETLGTHHQKSKAGYQWPH